MSESNLYIYTRSLSSWNKKHIYNDFEFLPSFLFSHYSQLQFLFQNVKGSYNCFDLMGPFVKLKSQNIFLQKSFLRMILCPDHDETCHVALVGLQEQHPCISSDIRKFNSAWRLQFPAFWMSGSVFTFFHQTVGISKADIYLINNSLYLPLAFFNNRQFFAIAL